MHVQFGFGHGTQQVGKALSGNGFEGEVGHRSLPQIFAVHESGGGATTVQAHQKRPLHSGLWIITAPVAYLPPGILPSTPLT
jgi:hypothetical protein